MLTARPRRGTGRTTPHGPAPPAPASEFSHRPQRSSSRGGQSRPPRGRAGAGPAARPPGSSESLPSMGQAPAPQATRLHGSGRGVRPMHIPRGTGRRDPAGAGCAGLTRTRRAAAAADLGPTAPSLRPAASGRWIGVFRVSPPPVARGNSGSSAGVVSHVRSRCHLPFKFSTPGGQFPPTSVLVSARQSKSQMLALLALGILLELSLRRATDGRFR
jgi:hypothetical protein